MRGAVDLNFYGKYGIIKVRATEQQEGFMYDTCAYRA
jgi:hypothetical protein